MKTFWVLPLVLTSCFALITIGSFGEEGQDGAPPTGEKKGPNERIVSTEQARFFELLGPLKSSTGSEYIQKRDRLVSQIEAKDLRRRRSDPSVLTVEWVLLSAMLARKEDAESAQIFDKTIEEFKKPERQKRGGVGRISPFTFGMTVKERLSSEALSKVAVPLLWERFFYVESDFGVRKDILEIAGAYDESLSTLAHVICDKNFSDFRDLALSQFKNESVSKRLSPSGFPSIALIRALRETRSSDVRVWIVSEIGEKGTEDDLQTAKKLVQGCGDGNVENALNEADNAIKGRAKIKDEF